VKFPILLGDVGEAARSKVRMGSQSTLPEKTTCLRLAGYPGMRHVNRPRPGPQPACDAGASAGCFRRRVDHRARLRVGSIAAVVAAAAARLLVTDVNGLTFSKVPRWVGTLMVDPRCLLAAVDRGDGPSNSIGLLVPSGVTTRGHRSLAVLAAPAYAAAMVVADALAFEGAGPGTSFHSGCPARSRSASCGP
jgi:hypothetical protein